MQTPGTKTAVEKTRKVYLPRSATWIDFWTGKTLEGGQTIHAHAPIQTMPLYVRAGSIIPMGPYLQYADEKPSDPLELRIYPGADGQFTLYEDGNDSYNYETGLHALITFAWENATGTLTISERKGSFPGMLKERRFTIVLVREDHGVGVDICPQPEKVVKYNGTALKVRPGD
jgi:alpha-D-xyloside xylohydrolase